MIKPTIGRVVLVQHSNSDQPEPAFITYVHGDSRVNVAGFTRSGIPFSHLNIQLLQDDDKRPEEGTTVAEWMPYQKEQAAKYDKEAVDTTPKT